MQTTTTYKPLIPLTILFFFMVLPFHSGAQGLVFNEVLPSNIQNIRDETGDYPDWIEFFNNSGQLLDVTGYSITDNRNEPAKWVFPPCFMKAGEYLVVFASGDRPSDTISFWNTLIRRGETWSYIIPTSEPPAAWRETGFDDAAWLTGPSGIGYGDGDDATIIYPTVSFYMRKTFEISDTSGIMSALLQIDFDDAFVAWLNGTEIARANIGIPGTPPPYYSASSALREATMYSGGQPEAYPVSNFRELLRQGENVLAIQVHNQSASSSDISCIPYFSIRVPSVPSVPSPQEISLPASSIYTGFKIDADGDTLYLFTPTGEIADSIVIFPVTSDYSFGRQPDGSGTWHVFPLPTPGEANLTTAYDFDEYEAPSFSVPAGFYPGPTQLVITTSNPGDTIRYTTDGSEPGDSSQVYTTPLDLTVPVVIRARVLRSGYLPGKISTGTYIIGRKPSLPVVSVTTDPGNLWDEDYGIYVMGKNSGEESPYFGANFWNDWERPAHVELFEPDGTQAFSIDAGIKITGNYSRANPQKSLAIYARKKYGAKEINYQIFPDKPIRKFESFVLRNSGNDWLGQEMAMGSMMRDLLATTLAGSLNQDVQAGRQAVVFLNGNYWGIENIREKISEHYVASNHGCDPEKVNMLEGNSWVVKGTAHDYTQLISYIQTHDLAVDANYDYVCTKMDVDNYMKYCITQIYIFNGDWPGNNIKFWQAGEGSPWRWIMFDTDFGFAIWDPAKVTDNTFQFALDDNGPEWPNPPWSTFLFRSLMKNERFRSDFIYTFADLLNTTFSPANVLREITRLRNNISSEIVYHTQKWGSNPETWSWTMNDFITYYAERRPDVLRSYMNLMFATGSSHQLTLGTDNPQGGVLKLNTLSLDVLPWKGTYFSNIPVHLRAEPNPGYRFAGWFGSKSDTVPVLDFGVVSDQTLIAKFEKIAGATESPVIINEINYKSAPENESEDWVELYNASAQETDISGWYLSDNDDGHRFEINAGTVLIPGEYLVLCRDTMAFTAIYPYVKNISGELGFGLSSSGEYVRLFTSNDIPEDSVSFEPVSPWPEEPNGTGYTLSLLSPELDNTLAENWASSEQLLGTPGKENFPQGPDNVNSPLLRITRMACYPNPFTESLTLSVILGSPDHIRLTAYDLNGRQMAMIADSEAGTGNHTFTWNASGFPAGLYIIRLETRNDVRYVKVIRNSGR